MASTVGGRRGERGGGGGRLNNEHEYINLEAYQAVAERQSVVMRRTWWSGFLMGFCTAAVIAAMIVHVVLG